MEIRINYAESEIKAAWKFGLNVIKTEIILYDLQLSLYWQSLIEIGIMFSAFIALLTSHSLLFFMHLIHLLRPYIALLIIFRLPRTHLILEKLPEDPIAAQTQAIEMIQAKFKNASGYCSYYLILSGISAVLDLLVLIYSLTNTGGHVNNYVFYANVAWVFLAFDFYVLLWALSVTFFIPENLLEASKEIADNTARHTKHVLNSIMSQVESRINIENK